MDTRKAYELEKEDLSFEKILREKIVLEYPKYDRQRSITNEHNLEL